MIALLMTPLRILADALGTGVMPAGGPTDALRTTARELAALHDASSNATAGTVDGWVGAGGDGVRTAASTIHRSTADLADIGPELAAVVDAAGAKVKSAADAIDALLASFETAVIGLGPAAFTPAGLASLVPVAVDHIARGATIVERTRTELDADVARLLTLARVDAPADVTVGGSDGRGVAITLPDGSVVHAPDERKATAVRAALSQQGVPYVWGGTTPDGFDCSGFTQWAYRQAGMELPRLAQDQDTAGYAVSRAELMPGDLAVWSGHVAMYVGNNQYIEAGDPVQLSPVRTTNLGQTFEGFYRPR